MAISGSLAPHPPPLTGVQMLRGLVSFVDRIVKGTFEPTIRHFRERAK